MILDLPRFLAVERPLWKELEAQLDALATDPERKAEAAFWMSFYALYQRASADLARLSTFASEPELTRYLEALVGRAYAEIHETRSRKARPSFLNVVLREFPHTVRRHGRALALAWVLTLVGALFGTLAVGLDPDSRRILLPFEHLQGDPRERVEAEEKGGASDRLEGSKATFSSGLITHNIRVSLLSFSLGFTWGVGTAVVLFYNGAILGAVALDYVRAGESRFLLGWLLPHGAVEIPAFVLAGQAGLVLAGALIGRSSREPLRRRLREISTDLVTMLTGIAALLVWAGIVEAFLSQYHEPFLPYALKIGLGVAEAALLTFFLARGGSSDPEGAR